MTHFVDALDIDDMPLDRSTQPNKTPGALEMPMVIRTNGWRFTYWTQQTAAAFVLLHTRSEHDGYDSYMPTERTLYVVAEKDSSSFPSATCKEVESGAG